MNPCFIAAYTLLLLTQDTNTETSPHTDTKSADDKNGTASTEALTENTTLTPTGRIFTIIPEPTVVWQNQRQDENQNNQQTNQETGQRIPDVPETDEEKQRWLESRINMTTVPPFVKNCWYDCGQYHFQCVVTNCDLSQGNSGQRRVSEEIYQNYMMQDEIDCSRQCASKLQVCYKECLTLKSKPSTENVRSNA